MIVVLMGVCGAGKSTVGRRLAAALDAEFVEGDAWHPPANVEKMRRERPLTDADRAPWLDALSAAVGRWLAEEREVVLACSALKRAYRERLAGGRGQVRFVHLTGPEALLRRRLEARRDHYMPPALLDSQLATLEPPGADEPAVAVAVDAPPDVVVARILRALGRATEAHVSRRG